MTRSKPKLKTKPAFKPATRSQDKIAKDTTARKNKVASDTSESLSQKTDPKQKDVGDKNAKAK